MPLTLSDVKGWSLSLGATEVVLTDQQLAVQLTRALAYVSFVTGRTYDDAPADLNDLWCQCVQMRIEQQAFQTQADYVETGTDDQIQTFSAGEYSETRTGDSKPGSIPLANRWAALREMLWMCCTEEKRDFWREELGGQMQPAFAVTEVDWEGGYDGFSDVPSSNELRPGSI